jgi:hypothetical protein
LLGAAQSLVLRGHVRHPWRWWGASCLAWPMPMAVIFLGAGLPDAAWPTWQVLALAAPTGLAAGALLGVSGTSVTGGLVVRLLRSRAGRAMLPGTDPTAATFARPRRVTRQGAAREQPSPRRR